MKESDHIRSSNFQLGLVLISWLRCGKDNESGIRDILPISSLLSQIGCSDLRFGFLKETSGFLKNVSLFCYLIWWYIWMSSLLVSNFTSDSSFKLVAESWWKCGEIEFNFLKDLALQSYKSAHCNKVGSATTERNVGLWAFRSCLVVKCYIYALNGKGIFVWKSMVGGLWKLFTILFTAYVCCGFTGNKFCRIGSCNQFSNSHLRRLALESV